jgi:hypothetical protein
MDGVDVFEVYAPVSNTAASANTLQYAPPRNEYLNLLNTVVGVVGTVGGVVAGGKAASSLATAVGNAAGQGYKYIQSPQANQSTNTTTTSTYTLGGSGVLGSGAYTDTSNHSMMLNSNNPVTSTTTTTNPYVGLPTTK